MKSAFKFSASAFVFAAAAALALPSMSFADTIKPRVANPPSVTVPELDAQTLCPMDPRHKA